MTNEEVTQKDGNTQPRGNYQRAIQEADEFFNVANDIDGRRSTGFYGLEYLVPYVVNLSFACEVYLKAIFIHSNLDYKRIHKLDELFYGLKDNVQTAIKSEFEEYLKPYGRNLDEFLTNYNNIFQDFRYSFEEKTDRLSIHSTCLGAFAHSLKNYCHNCSKGVVKNE